MRKRSPGAAKVPVQSLFQQFWPTSPEGNFLGDKLRCGFGGDGGGSQLRLALTMLAGGKVKDQRRKMQLARERLAEMAPEQITALAKARGAPIYSK